MFILGKFNLKLLKKIKSKINIAVNQNHEINGSEIRGIYEIE
jgi:hypothetical protein